MVSDEEYGGLPVENSKYPPKQCQDCGKYFQPSKFTWNYAKRCPDCRKPKGPKTGPGVKTKQVPCSTCGDIVEVGIFAALTQYCDKCRTEKGITKKGKKIEKPKEINRNPPEEKIKEFVGDTENIRKNMLNVYSNGDKSTNRFFAAVSQLEAERLIFSGLVDGVRENRLREDITLYLLPRGYRLSRNMLYKRYKSKEYIALVFTRGQLHHISWRFERPGRESSRNIATRETYEKLSDEVRKDIDLIVAITGVLNEDPNLTDEYMEEVKKQQGKSMLFADVEEGVRNGGVI